MTKRIRRPKAKPGELKAVWGRVEPGGTPSIVYCWAGHGSESADGRILSNALEGNEVHLGNNLIKELEKRGYDLTTLKFSIQRKP